MRTVYSPNPIPTPSPNVEIEVDIPEVEEVAFTLVTNKKGGCHMQVHLSGNNVPMVKPPSNHTILPFTVATFSATCLMVVL